MRKLFATVLTLAVIVPMGILYPKAETEPTVSVRGQLKEQYQEKIETTVENRCGIAEDRINLVISRYQNNSQRRTSVHQKINDKVTTILDTMDDGGYNTTEARAELAKMNTLSSELENLVNQKIQLLEESQNYECGNSDGAFKTKIQESIQLNLQIREKVLEIRTQYQNQLRPALQDLRDQVTDSE